MTSSRLPKTQKAAANITNMKKLSGPLITFIVIAGLIVPLCLWIYQIARFETWSFDISRVPADRIVVTSAKALLFGVILTAAMIQRKKAATHLERCLTCPGAKPSLPKNTTLADGEQAASSPSDQR